MEELQFRGQMEKGSQSWPLKTDNPIMLQMNMIYGRTPIQNFRVGNGYVFEILCLENFYSTEWMVWVLYIQNMETKKILYIKQTKHSWLKFEKKCNK